MHPLILAWVAGAVVPLVVHLLSRSQYRAVPWGAMMFLTGTDAGPRVWVQIRQWALLFLRMALVGLLSVALARPVIAARYAWVPTAGLTTGGPAAAVILLDDSAGMGYQHDGKNRLDEAKQVALQILAALKRGDQATLLLAGTRESQTVPPPNADLQSIAGQVVDLQPDFGQADFAADLTKAADVLSRAGPTDREIFIICDHQAGSWRNVTEAFRKRWIARQSAGPLPRVTVIPVGGEEADNIAVEAIDFPDHAATRDEPNLAQVRVHNYGPTAAVSVPLTVWTGMRNLHETTLTIPAHGVQSVSVPIRFGEVGSRVVSAAVKSTGLTSDDRLDVAVDVLDMPRLLVVVGQSDSTTRSTQPTQPDATLAMSIYPTNRTSRTLAPLARTIFSSDMNLQLLSSSNVVLFDDAESVALDQVQSLRDYVGGGGGVLILPGNQTPLLGDSGLLHTKLGNICARPARMSSFDPQHPILRLLPDRLRAGLLSTPYRYWTLSTPAADTRVLARYTTGEPAILERIGARGRVILLTMQLSRQLLSTAPVQALLHSTVLYLGKASAVDRNIAPGQPMIAATTQPVDDRSASVQFLSTGTREPAVVTHQPDHTEVRYTNTNRPGTYRLRYKTSGKETVLNYVANAGRPDSDLTPLTPEQWSTLSTRLRFDKIDLSHTTVAQAIDTQRGGREIWIDLLGGVLALMALEMVLSRWWCTPPQA